MKRLIAVALSVFACVAAVAEGDAPAAAPQYSCSLKVETPKQVNKKTDSGKDNKNNNGSSTKTIARKMEYPVKVSFSGKDIPTSGIVLRACFIGNSDGEAKVLGETTTDVKLEKNVFKATLSSPEAVITETMKRQGRRIVSDSSGDRHTGCIIQLLVDGKVKKSYASKPGWKKLAQADTLDTEAVLKIR